MKNYMWERLETHIGHHIVCVGYGESMDDLHDICIECEDCGCVLVSAEDYDIEEVTK